MSSSSYLAKANEIEKKWYIIDAAGKPLGRVAACAATILRGKHRPEFTPGVDCGEFVIIINAKDAVLTGNKLSQKKWYRHTGYIGHLKEVSYSDLMEKRPEKAMELAVKGMIPKNTLGRKCMTKIRIYKDANHGHEAQNPIEWTAEIR
ncbi:MAG: 50S ribosomal protein L13 [Oscillospiraceae bacterium]